MCLNFARCVCCNSENDERFGRSCTSRSPTGTANPGTTTHGKLHQYWGLETSRGERPDFRGSGAMRHQRHFDKLAECLYGNFYEYHGNPHSNSPEKSVIAAAATD